MFCCSVIPVVYLHLSWLLLTPGPSRHRVGLHDKYGKTLQWRHNGRDSVSNHRRLDCFLKRLFRHRTKKTSKLRVTGLCEEDSPVTGEFLAQGASNAENVSIWWGHHDVYLILGHIYDSYSILLGKEYPNNGIIQITLSVCYLKTNWKHQACNMQTWVTRGASQYSDVVLPV